MLTYQSDYPSRICLEWRRKELRALGVETTGYDRDMERILTENGFGLPTLQDDGTYGFRCGNYTRIALTYVDSLADELILLKTLKMI